MADNHEKEVSKNILHGNIYTDYRWDGTDFTTINDKSIDKMHVAASEEVEFEYKLNQLDSDLNQKGASSFDSVFSPYSTYFSTSGFPGFEVPTNKTAPNSLKLNPFNPNNALSLYYAPTGSKLYQASLATSGSPTADELAFSQADTDSPIGQERGDLRKGKPEGWMDSGHSIYMAINGTGNRYSAEFEEQFTESSGYDVEVTNIRAVGLRAPVILTGWGFDTNAKPVPADTDNPDVFASGAFSDPSLWKSGPVDFRWDNAKKVWVTGGGQGIMKFRVTGTSDDIARNASACDYVVTTVYEIGCGTEGVSVGDTGVLVFDDDLCFFNLPYSVLIGLRGTAQEMVNPWKDHDGEEDCVEAAKALGACRWVVTGLCCGEEILAP